MYGWVGTDANVVGGGAVERPTKVPDTANHASKKKPRKQASASVSSRSGTKRRRTMNPAETLVVGAASTLPASTHTSTSLSLSTNNDNPAESLRRALLVNDDLGIMQNRGVLQAIIDAISSELLDDGFPSSQDKARMTDIAQLARQVRDATNDGASSGRLAVTNAKKKKPGAVAHRKKTPSVSSAGNKKKRKKSTTIPRTASADLSNGGVVGSTSHWRWKVCPSNGANDEGTRNNKRKRPKHRASAGSAALSLQSATVTPSIAAATTKNRFDQRLEELKQFKEKHGHFKVPSRGGNKSLYEWLHAKKKAYAKEGRTSSRSILPEEVKALQDIGVDMDGNDKKTSVLFRQWLEELKRFKEKHGHFKVPKSNSKLYAWLYVKKRAYAEGGGYRFYRITPEEAEALRDIGVDMGGRTCSAKVSSKRDDSLAGKPQQVGGAGSAVLASGRSRFGDRRRRAGRDSSRDGNAAVAAVPDEGQEQDQDDDDDDGGGGNDEIDNRSIGGVEKEERADTD